MQNRSTLIAGATALSLTTLAAIGSGQLTGNGPHPGVFSYPVPTSQNPMVFKMSLGGGLAVETGGAVFDATCNPDSDEDPFEQRSLILSGKGGKLGLQPKELEAYTGCFGGLNTAEAQAGGTHALKVMATNHMISFESHLSATLMTEATDSGPLCDPCGPDLFTSSAGGAVENRLQPTVSIVPFHLKNPASLKVGIDVTELVEPLPLESVFEIWVRIEGLDSDGNVTWISLDGWAEVKIVNGVGELTDGFTVPFDSGNYIMRIVSRSRYEADVSASCCDLEQAIDATIDTIARVELIATH